jgi:Lon protease-like protein
VTAGLPLFPLGSVLFPGLVLPLNVFEERYRALVRHLMAEGEEGRREFGVVAIRRGWEVEHHSGDAASLSLHEVGCTAEIRECTERPDGRFDLVTVGRRRFRLVQVDPASAPYPVADVAYLEEPLGDAGEADRLASGVLDLFQRYLRLIRPGEVGEQLPDDPTVLSHLIAATTGLPLAERQSLLAAEDTAARLRTERTLLAREVTLLRQVRAVPVPLAELAVTNSPN